MSHSPFYDELIALMSELGIEVRLDTFFREQPNAGGYCLIKGKELIVLDAEKSEGERCRVLLEVVEKLKRNSSIAAEQLSPGLLHKLIERGNAPWTQQARTSSKPETITTNAGRPALRLVYDSSRDI